MKKRHSFALCRRARSLVFSNARSLSHIRRELIAKRGELHRLAIKSPIRTFTYDLRGGRDTVTARCRPRNNGGHRSDKMDYASARARARARRGPVQFSIRDRIFHRRRLSYRALKWVTALPLIPLSSGCSTRSDSLSVIQ